LAALGLSTLLAFGFGVPAASGASAIETGVWWTVQQAGNPLPLPPSVPDGGLWVEQAPGGKTAVSAVRLPLGDGEVPIELALTLHQPIDPAGSTVQACATTSSWKAVQGGAFADAPVADCPTFAALGHIDADGKTMRFDLAGYGPGQEANLVMIPASPPLPVVGGLPTDGVAPNPVATTFDVTFEKPTLDALVTVFAPPSSTDGYDDGSDGSVYGGSSFFTPLDTGSDGTGADGYDPSASSGYALPYDSGLPATYSPGTAGSSTAATGNGAGGASIPNNATLASGSTTAKALNDTARFLAGLAFLGLFLFGGSNAGTFTGRGRVSIYGWPPPPSAPVKPRREGDPPPSLR
jgi:hypothetical protein